LGRMCTPFFRKPKLGQVGEDLAAGVFQKYAPDGKMGAAEFLRFLQQEQGETNATLESAQQLLELNRKEVSKAPQLHSADMKKEDFINFILSPNLNGAIDTNVYQDMTQPISHYWIFTGHNSYLTGNQLSSASSEVPIIAALKHGVRVVELDLWSDDKGGIKVTHGNTLTDPVPFVKCLTAIKENAFIASPYPVCVTLEDHLTSALQAQAAEMIIKIFGDALFYPHTTEALKEFPSPEDLKGRIVISTKPPKEYLEAAPVAKTAAQNKQVVKELQKEDKQTAPLSDKVGNLHLNEGVPPAAAKDVAPPSAAAVAAKGAAGHHGSGDSDSDEDDMQKNPNYARLITIRQVKPVKGTALKDRLVNEAAVKRISLAESKVKDVAEEFPQLLVKFTQRNILRVYPAGTRIDSSNYNPVLSWNHGAQMVALNMQGFGKELWQAHGRFRSNGGCGYVLKPRFLLENVGGIVFNPLAHRSPEMKLTVKAMMTLGWDKAFSKRHFDLLSPPDFFTRVLIAGVPADVAKWKTRPVKDTWVPYWNEETVFELKVPELALLRIEVRDEDEESRDEFEGQSCLPVTELRNGYRCVQLYDKAGIELTGVKMLFHFQKEYLHKSTSTTPHPLTTSA
jgi:phosphatidylinositol phospholipase C delta